MLQEDKTFLFKGSIANCFVLKVIADFPNQHYF